MLRCNYVGGNTSVSITCMVKIKVIKDARKEREKFEKEFEEVESNYIIG